MAKGPSARQALYNKSATPDEKKNKGNKLDRKKRRSKTSKMVEKV